jgi:hypothetical protein
MLPIRKEEGRIEAKMDMTLGHLLKREGKTQGTEDRNAHNQEKRRHRRDT